MLQKITSLVSVQLQPKIDEDDDDDDDDDDDAER